MIKRKIFDKLLKEKDNKKISIVLGARQVGKTTILNAIFEILSKTNKCLYLNLDITSNIEKISTFENLINTLKFNGFDEKQEKFFYLFLDEFQKYDSAAIIMKNVYDSFDNIKIYASGSSSLKIKGQIQESLAGRKSITLLYSLDFEEFLWFKEEDSSTLASTVKLFGDDLIKITPKLYELLNEVLVFGGYPEVALKKSNEDKIKVLQSIFDLYADKDLIDYLDKHKILGAKKLIEYLAVNNGQKTKYDEVAGACTLHYSEVKEYIEILKETYIVSILKPFFTNKNKEIVKIPKIYFMDNGVRNFFINNFNPPELREDKGFLFEGYVLSEILKSGKDAELLKFWQDKNKHEVDLLVGQIPIEVKFKPSLKNEDFIGMNAFLDEYPSVKKGYLINPSSQREKGRIELRLPYVLDKTIFP